MTSSFTQNIGLEEPALGDYVNDWNVPVNNNWTLLDQVEGGYTQINVTSGDITLTVAQCAYARIFISGSLTSDVGIYLPTAVGGRKYFVNTCTLNGFVVVVRNAPSDYGVIIPSNLLCPVVFTQGNAFYDDYQSVPPGTIHCFAGLNVPPGFLLCNGISLATATFPLLFAAIGYTYGGAGANFNLPDTRGRILAGADNMGGSAANRLTGYSFGTTGGEQTHVLTTAELAAHNHGVTDPGHAHAITDPGHTHTLTAVQNGGGTSSFAGGGAVSLAPTITTNSSTTGITINSNTTGITTQNNGSGTAHNNIQPTIAINHIIRF